MSVTRATCKMAPLAACVIAMAMPAASQAAANSYVLRHPKHEHCRAHYTRKVKKVRVRQHGKIVAVAEIVCIYTPPKAPPAPVEQTPAPTPTPTPAPAPTPAPTPAPAPIPPPIPSPSRAETSTSVFASLLGGVGTGERLHYSVWGLVIGTGSASAPITFAMSSLSTGQPVASFTGVSGAFPCSITFTYVPEGETLVWKGEAVGVEPACPFPTVSEPAHTDTYALRASYAGDAAHEPSVSRIASFG
jgi:hypothetical protein